MRCKEDEFKKLSLAIQFRYKSRNLTITENQVVDYKVLSKQSHGIETEAKAILSCNDFRTILRQVVAFILLGVFDRVNQLPRLFFEKCLMDFAYLVVNQTDKPTNNRNEHLNSIGIINIPSIPRFTQRNILYLYLNLKQNP